MNDIEKNNARIAMVIPYFGVFPNYINFFLKTCINNRNIDFLIFTDIDTKDIEVFGDNIIINKFSMSDFSSVASKKMFCDVVVNNAYKLCDFKPMYGKIFEDYLVKYDFWGFCDIDILLGNTSAVLTDILLDNFDIISAHPQYLSGPFSLFRNADDVNNLYKQSKDWLKVVMEDKNFLFDEASNVMPYLWQGSKIFDYPSEVESMTHVLMNEKKHSFNVLFSSFITERVEETLTWDNGSLRDDQNNEIIIFHYIVYKNKWNFSVPKWCDASLFNFDEAGFFWGGKNKISVSRGYDVFSNYLIKIKGIGSKFNKKMGLW